MSFQSILLQNLKKYDKRIAIESEDTATTYAGLLDITGKIGSYLVNKGLKKETLVGICLEDKADIIYSIIGVMNAGCVFVPIDNSLPVERIKVIAEDLNLKYIISSERVSLKYFGAHSHTIFSLEEILSEYTRNPGTELPPVQPEDSAYIYFTSGTTGKPKGIIGKNSSLLQFIEWEVAAFDIGAQDRFGQFIVPYFDAFLRDIFVPLFTGATICIPPKADDFLSPIHLIPWIDSKQISIIHCVPSLFYAFNHESLTPDKFRNLKYIMMSGERILPAALKKWYDVFGTRVELVNFYGPTETTMIRAYHRISPADVQLPRIPVGRPICDTELVILDADAHPCPALVAGDLFIVSDYLTKGYVNDDQLTQEKFVSIQVGDARRKAFKTGDQALLLPDGNVDLLGRNDRQIKINGIRIEPDEIENVLTRAPFIKNAVVFADSDSSGNARLTSFFVKNGKSELSANVEEQARVHLENHLPKYMVPSVIKEVKEFPLLSNGKIDVKLLASQRVSPPGVAPESDLEREILEIWKKILGDKPIFTDRSFFISGGNSLAFMNLIAMLNKKYGTKLTLSKLFQNLTIRAQAQLIIKSTKDGVAAIPPVTKAHYRLASVQKRLYFLHEFDKSSVAYNMPEAVRIHGKLELDQFEQAFNRLIDRHANFRTSFVTQQGEIVQQVAEQVAFAISYLESSEDQVQALMRDFVTPFDLSQAPLLRVGLVRLHSDEHVMMVDMHHIISDGVSLGLLIKDFMLLYKGEALPPLKLQYKDYAEWQQGAEHGEQLEKQKSFWVKTFAGELEPLALQTDYKRPLTKQYAGDSLAFALSEQQTSTLKAMVDQAGATLFMGLLSVLGVMLSKLSNQEDIVIGTPVDGRRHADVKEIIGMFVNTLPLRVYPRGELRFSDFLEQVKSTSLSGFDNQAYPFEDLVDALGLQRDTSRNPLFDVMLNFQNFEKRALSIPGLAVTAYESEHRLSKFDLTLYGAESEGQVFLTFQYSTCLFKRETIERYVSYFNNTLDCVCAHPEILIKDVSLWDEDAQKRAKEEFGKSIESVTEPIQCKLDRSFKKHGNQCAVAYQGKAYTFSEIEVNANRVVNVISGYQLTKGSTIGILCENRQWTISAIVGVLRSGMVFVPLDTTLPNGRLASIINQVGCTHIITDKNSEERAGLGDGKTNWLTICEVEKQEGVLAKPNADYDVEDIVYVYFTSGTTGNPKGIAGKNKGLAHFIEWEILTFNIDNTFRCSQFTNPGFDVFLRDIFVPLCAGGTICIPDERTLLDGARIRKWIAETGINLIHCVPSFFKVFTEEIDDHSFGALKFVLLAGEKLMPKELTNWYGIFGDRISLINVYGPTETTLAKGFYPIQPVDIAREYIPVVPITGAQFILLGKDGDLCPEMVTGEICIRTPFRSAGYINDSEANEKRFIQNPFSGDERDKLYRTGDLGRRNYKGEIEIQGRLDHQIKFNGIRIEPDDIKENILKFPGIKHAVVALKKNGQSDQVICAYYVSDTPVENAELRAFLASVLPRYMLPSFLCQLASLPLTVNGKIDRQSLPAPVIEAGEDSVKPANETEEKLAKIWTGILGLNKDEINVTKSFFELGGHSLKAITVTNRVFKELGVELPLKKVFEYQSIRELGSYIEGLERQTYRPISRAVDKEYYPVSSAQQRMYFLYEFDRTSTAYNMSYVLRLEGMLDRERLTHAFRQLIARHESLRTSFASAGWVPVQKVAAESDFQVSYAAATQEQLPAAIEAFIRPFDLSQAPLLRVGLLRVSAQEHVLLVDMHHIISDGVSLGLLIKDFMALYREEALSPLSLQYKDYAEWQQSPAHQERLAGHRAFWLEEFAQPVSLLELPIDYARPPVKTHAGAVLRFRLSRQETGGLRALAEKEGATLFMVLLSVFKVLLRRLGNQEDLVVGTPVAGRGHADLEDIIGMFVNSVAIRTQANGALSFSQFLQAVKKKTLACFEHQSYQLEALIDELGVERDTSRNPLFDVMFVLQNFEETQLELPGLKLTPYGREHRVSKFDLTLTAVEAGEEVLLDLEYCNALFKPQTAERLVAYYKRVVAAVVADPGQQLSQIELLSQAEKHQLLVEFNDTAVAYPQGKTIIDLFEQQARRRADEAALQCGGESMSYRQFQNRVDALAAHLLEEGIEPGDVVGVFYERSFELMVSLYGVMKAGGVYLPIEGAHPAERMAFLLRDSGARLLLAPAQAASRLEVAVPVVDLSSLSWSEPAARPESKARPQGLAYIIYTSGSTGQPKGVMIQHNALVNRIHWMQRQYPIGSADVILQKTPKGFDVSLWELVWWSQTGSVLCLLGPGEEKDPQKLTHAIKANRVSVLHFVPSMLQVYLDYLEATHSEQDLKTLEWVFCSGEVLHTHQVNRFNALLRAAHGTKLVNLYGPTEATIDVSYFDCYRQQDYRQVPIGKPIDNTALYVLDAHRRLQPLGVAGELYIAGEGVGRGYVNNEALTRERFVANPYRPGGTMYKTGDLARVLADGNIEYLGRLDHQVKIRGIRIEPGEIERLLTSHQNVKDAVVVARERGDDKYLVGYYVAEEEVPATELREHLWKHLPEYMVPAHYVHLQSLPLTRNGKLNKKALPEPEFKAGDDYIAPTNEIEEQLTQIWSNILAIDKALISTNKSFFELGGHSLMTPVLMHDINDEFNVAFPLNKLFQFQTVSALARCIAETITVEQLDAGR